MDPIIYGDIPSANREQRLISPLIVCTSRACTSAFLPAYAEKSTPYSGMHLPTIYTRTITEVNANLCLNRLLLFSDCRMIFSRRQIPHS